MGEVAGGGAVGDVTCGTAVGEAGVDSDGAGDGCGMGVDTRKLEYRAGVRSAGSSPCTATWYLRPIVFKRWD